MKRYIYIIIGIVVAAVVAILVLLFIKSRSSGTTTLPDETGSLPVVGTQTNTSAASGTSAENNPSTILALPSSSSSSTPAGSGSGQTSIGSFGMLSTDPVLDYFVNAQNQIIAIQPTGSVITISNGQSSVISTSSIDDIISASFSYDGKKILVSFGSPSNPETQLFNVASDTWTALPQGLQSPQWSPTNYQVAYLANAGTGRMSLSMINTASLKSGVATLLTLYANDISLQWLNKTLFVLSSKPSAYTNGSILLFNSQNKSLTPIVLEDGGDESIWSHTANPLGLVFSDGTSGQNPSLQLETPSGNLLEQLNFLTLPSKCLFGSQASTSPTSYLPLYCGIPRSTSGFSSAHLPDDYNMMSIFTSDNIYEIDTASGTTNDLFSDQTQNLDTSDLKIFNNTLFFVNRYDQKLYGLVVGQ
jgi:hypothetical protein